MEYIKNLNKDNWQANFSEEEQQQSVQALEEGKIILLPQLAFELSTDEKAFLTPEYSTHSAKNISLNPLTLEMRGLKSTHNTIPLKNMLKRYAQCTQHFLSQLFPMYTQLQIGRTSFRPVEIKGRKPPSYRKDDTRLHVDAFPASPLQGKRIIRVFTNLNPNQQARVWRVGEPFEVVAKHFLPTTRKQWLGRAALLHCLKITKSRSTEYDYRMLQIHNNMKKDMIYQNNAKQMQINFAPNSTWIVQTDQVSHAALAGQYVLEQTFYLPIKGMQNPSLSPLHTLERILNHSLI